MPATLRKSIGDRGRRVWSRRKTDHAGMGHGYSGSVPGSQSSIFLQAMGQCTRVPAALGR